MADEQTTPPVAATTPVKPGWKTTEFWLHLIAVLAGAIMSSGLPSNNKVVQVAGMATMLLGALGYGVQRASVKNAAMLLLCCLPFLGGCKAIDAATLKEFQTDDASLMKELSKYLDADLAAGVKTADAVATEKQIITAHNTKILIDVRSVDPAEEQTLVAEFLAYIQNDSAKSAGLKKAWGNVGRAHLDLFASAHR